jgi:hypothetical protein
MEWVTVTDIPREAWRRLLEFANLEIAEQAIAVLHGSDREQRSNRRKQAAQMRVSLLQAREYFAAAEQSSLYTNPSHLYYGMVSLASALLLLRGDGTASLDYLRKDPANRSHGLIFSTGADARSAATGLEILAQSRAEIAGHGYFKNWMAVVPPQEPIRVRLTRLAGTTVSSSGLSGNQQFAGIGALVGRRWTLLEILCRLPDLTDDLVRSGMRIPACRLSYEIQVDVAGARRMDRWLLHGARSPEDLSALLEHFEFHHGGAEMVSWEMADGGCAAVIRLTTPIDFVTHFTWPSCRERLDNEYWAFGKLLDTSEFTDFYTVTFGLSMLARYYPDLWVTAIDAHTKASKAIENLVAVALQKVPLLALKLMEGYRTVISAHRPPWFD